ncbi:MAG: peptidoglycan-associated lipoprotein Pal [Limnobacter sp.]|nr:peptidoglycan-associated lipoprotein Pal [Limnobacter sp.]
MKNVLRSLSLATLLAVLAACSSTPIDQKAPIESKTGNEVSTDTRAVPTVEPEKANMDPLNDPEGKLAERSVYFDLDEYSIKPQYRDLIQAHARYLAANPSRSVVIQGHTDERGGAEYNLALGQRRADAVKTLMKALGVSESQVETVSFGKEKPRAFGSNEAAWAENRRADIVYK